MLGSCENHACMYAPLCHMLIITTGRGRKTTRSAQEWVDNPEQTLDVIDDAVSYLNSALIRSVFMILIIFYVPLCNFTLQYFNCSHQADGTWSLDAQPSLYCYDHQHKTYMIWAVLGCIVYLLGIPCVAGIVLYKHRDDVCEIRV